MSHLTELAGIAYVPNFIPQPDALLQQLLHQVAWDTRMQARLTASFGKAYNYSQMTYPEQAMLPALATLLPAIAGTVGFVPNNCLINHYADGHARMGYHADQTDVLVGDTGIVIVSLGSERNITFRNKTDPSIKISHTLAHGSLFYMNQSVQAHWQHAIPACKTDAVRLSLTFRCLK